MRKEQKKEGFPWQKVFIIAVGVLFVFMMVLSAMGSSWLQSFRTVAANDSVIIDFTLRDTNGRVVLTTDQNIYRTGILSGGLPFYTSPLTVRAGYADNPTLTGIAAQNYYISQTLQGIEFGILGDELNAIGRGVLGMKANEKKTISIPESSPLVLPLTNYEFMAMGGNFTTIGVGDLVPLGISETPLVSGLEGYNETPTNAAWRVGTVINKTVDALEVQHYYPTAEITIRSIR